MVYRILQKIRIHKELVTKFEAKELSDTDLERHLLEELTYFHGSSIEEKLNKDIEEQEQVLSKYLNKISDIVIEKEINMQSLENLVYSEINSLFFEHL